MLNNLTQKIFRVLFSILLTGIPVNVSASDISEPAALYAKSNDSQVSGILDNSTPLLISTSGAGTVTFDLSGNSTQTVVTEGSKDGTTYFPVSALPIGGGTAVTSISSEGTWTVSVTGLSNFRLRTSAYVSGFYNVNLTTSAGSNSITCIVGCLPSSYVASVASGNNILLTGTASNPIVNVLSNPIFDGLSVTNLLDSNCVISGANGILKNIGFTCGATTSQAFTIPSIGSNVTVNTTNNLLFYKYTPVTITDGINLVSGYVNSNISNSNSFSLYVNAVVQGAVGNQLQSSSSIILGNPISLTSVSGVGNISVTNGTTTPQVSITDAPTFTGTASFGNIIDNGLSASNCVGTNSGKQLVSNSACVQSLTASGNIINTGSAFAPNVNVTNAPTFLGLGTFGSIKSSDLSANYNYDCLQSNTNGTIGKSGAPCLRQRIVNTAITLPAVGSSFTITLNDALYAFTGQLVRIDNILQNRNFFAKVTSADYTPGNGASTWTFKVTQIDSPTAPGDVFPIGSTITPLGFRYYAGNGISINSDSVISATGTGTVSNVTGSGNIISSGGTTPDITTTNAPTFSGNVSAGSVSTGTGGDASVFYLNGTGTTQQLATIGTASGGTHNTQRAFIIINNNGGSNPNTNFGTDDTRNVATINGKCFAMSYYVGAVFQNNLETVDCSGNVGISGALHATSFYGSGANITSGTIPNTALVTTPVTSVTATGNLSSTGGTTPVVSITDAPTFPGATSVGSLVSTGAISGSSLSATGLTNNKCLRTSAGGLLSAASQDCYAFAQNTSSYMVPAVGSTVNVTVNDPTLIQIGEQVILGTANGSSQFLGEVTSSGVGSANNPFTVKNRQIVSGAAGDTIPAGGLAISNGLAYGAVVQSITGGTNIVIGGTSTAPTVAVTNSPSFSGNSKFGAPGTPGSVTNAPIAFANNSGTSDQLTRLFTSNGLVAGTTGNALTVGANGSSIFAMDYLGDVGINGTLITGGTITVGNLSPNKCVQTLSGSLLQSAANPCVVGLTAGSNIAVGTGTTPSVAVVSNPTFTGGINVGTNGTSAAGVNFAAASGNTVVQVNGNQTVATVAGTALNINNGTSSYLSLDTSSNLGINGALRATTYYGSGANINAATIPGSALVTNPTFSGTTKSTSFAVGASGTAQSDAFYFGNSTSAGNNTIMDSGNSTVNTVASNVYRLRNGTNTLQSVDSNGNLGLSGGLFTGSVSIFNIPSGDFFRTGSSGCTSLNWYSGASGGATASAQPSAFGAYCSSTGSTIISLDTSGNLGIKGAYSSASLRKLKNNIINVSQNKAMDVIRKTNIVQYCYKTEKCSANQENHLGFIADDTDSVLSGKDHTMMDVNATAALSLYGVQQNDKRISKLENTAQSKQNNEIERLKSENNIIKIILELLVFGFIMLGLIIRNLFRIIANK